MIQKVKITNKSNLKYLLINNKFSLFLYKNTCIFMKFDF